MNWEEEQKRVENLPYAVSHNLRALLDGFKKAIHTKNTSVVILIDGRSGMGKSTLAMQVAKYCDPTFDLPQVYFTPEEFLSGLAEAQVGSCHVFDEALLISSRAALSSINRAIVQAMSMIRSKRLFVIFCCNSIFDIDRNIALSRADLLLSVYGDSLTDRGKYMAFFKGMDKHDRIKMLYLLGKKYYDYSKPKSNFNTKFSGHFPLDEAEYEKKKQQGVNRFLNKEEKKESYADKVRLWRSMKLYLLLRTFVPDIKLIDLAKEMGFELQNFYDWHKIILSKPEAYKSAKDFYKLEDLDFLKPMVERKSVGIDNF